MKLRWLKASVAGLLAVSAWLTVNPQPAQAQVIAVAAGVWGWRNIVAPRVGGPWIAPDVRFRPFAEDGWYYDELPAPNSSAQVFVWLPDENAQVWIQSRLMPMTGRERVFMSPPLEQGYSYTYQIRARWGDGKQTVEMTRSVPVHAGEQVYVDFSQPAGK